MEKTILEQISEQVERINDTFTMIEDWEISPIVAYRKFKYFEWIIKNALKNIESSTIDMVEDNPLTEKEFIVSVRRTLQYKESPLYIEKYDELKSVESAIKIATDMKEKGATYVDEDWVLIDPVDVKFKKILTYKPK